MLRIADHILSAEPVRQGSTLYKAITKDNRVSAVKVFPFSVRTDEYQRFTEQVNALAEAVRYNSLYVPTILSWGLTQEGNHPFIETEWIEGFDLTNIPNEGKEITIDEIGNIAEQISRVLTFCHSVVVVHGNVGSRHIIWDKKRQHYILTGFKFGLNVPDRASYNFPISTSEQRDIAFKQKDIHDLGLVLLTLINAHLLPAHSAQLTNSKSALIGTELKDGTVMPAWLGNCLYRALTNNEESFKTAHEIYSYIILHHKTAFPANRWFRSKPQQPLTLPPKQRAKITSRSGRKLQSALASGMHTGRENMRFVFDRRIALGLVVAGLLVGFSIVAQNRQNRNSATAPTNETVNMRMQDTTTNTAEQATGQYNSVTPRQKEKVAKTKQAGDRKAVQKEHPISTSTDQQEEDTSFGAYKVRSRAYFHNQPDERTRRKGFIVHWNNAVLHPLKEVNDFVYVVYTNDEGQTSKGWLRKKDLVKQ